MAEIITAALRDTSLLVMSISAVPSLATYSYVHECLHELEELYANA
jgi:hypothetical protein